MWFVPPAADVDASHSALCGSPCMKCPRLLWWWWWLWLPITRERRKCWLKSPPTRMRLSGSGSLLKLPTMWQCRRTHIVAGVNLRENDTANAPGHVVRRRIRRKMCLGLGRIYSWSRSPYCWRCRRIPLQTWGGILGRLIYNMAGSIITFIICSFLPSFWFLFLYLFVSKLL